MTSSQALDSRGDIYRVDGRPSAINEGWAVGESCWFRRTDAVRLCGYDQMRRECLDEAVLTNNFPSHFLLVAVRLAHSQVHPDTTFFAVAP